MIKPILLCLFSSFALSLALCAAEIPLLKKLGAGQNILCYVKEHKTKGGTPTMGGLGFISAACVSVLLLCGGGGRSLHVALAVGLAYLAVGFLDDMLKKRRKDNLGLRAYQKIFFQLAVAAIASLFCCFNGFTRLRLPYTLLSFEIGYWTLPLGIFVFLATVNSVNLTDGLDGLAGSVSAVFFLLTGVLIALQGGDGELFLLCCCLAGALGAYLVFNTNRASVFMGDTGSLSLGGFAAAVAMLSGNALCLPVSGVMFVASSISVILQVIYYKRTGKRIFLMAPVHHHFQERGFSEGKIAYVYAAVTAAAGLSLFFPYI